MKKIKLIVLAILIFFSGYLLARTSSNDKTSYNYVAHAIREGQNGLINPIIEYEISQAVYLSQTKKFDDDLNILVNNLKKDKNITDISVYFRSLNDGPWFGINQDDKYFPASLLKVPLMIAWLKKAETNPELLTKQITYSQDYKNLGDFNDGQYFTSSKRILPNETYTVDELITYMIKYSDNNAKNLLVLSMDNPEDLFQVYVDLGLLTPPEIRGVGDVLSTHENATFYRVLYNATYLNKDMSKKALALLSETEFRRGISESIPTDIKIAHKFGEHTDDRFKQLHDCGIIYSKNPYILCIMTRGKDFVSLEQVINKISQSVYQEVSKQE